jgi:hypothetical protein
VDDTAPILPVTSAFYHFNEIRRLFAFFDNDYEILYFNKIESFLYSKNIENMKNTKIDNFSK